MAANGEAGALQAARLINQGLVAGETVAEIHRAIKPLMESWPVNRRVSSQAIRRHAERHLLLDIRVIRAILKRARERSVDPQGMAWVTDSVAAAEVVLFRGTQAMVDERRVPNPSETLAAGRFLRDIAQEADNFSLRELEGQLEDLIAVTRAVVPPGHWDQIVVRLRQLWGEDPRVLGPALEPDPARPTPRGKARTDRDPDGPAAE